MPPLMITQRIPLSFRQATVSCMPPIRGMSRNITAMSLMFTFGSFASHRAMSRLMNSDSSISPLMYAWYVHSLSTPKHSCIQHQELLTLVRTPSISKQTRSYFAMASGTPFGLLSLASGLYHRTAWRVS